MEALVQKELLLAGQAQDSSPQFGMRSVGASHLPPFLMFCHCEGDDLSGGGGGGLGHVDWWDWLLGTVWQMPLSLSLWQNGTLKTALLDYIKRCRPGDSEKHNMIALCFSMCREIGENHEAAANVQLKLIESQPWGKDPPVQVEPSGGGSGWVGAALVDPSGWAGRGFVCRLFFPCFS